MSPTYIPGRNLSGLCVVLHAFAAHLPKCQTWHPRVEFTRRILLIPRFPSKRKWEYLKLILLSFLLFFWWSYMVAYGKELGGFIPLYRARPSIWPFGLFFSLASLWFSFLTPRVLRPLRVIFLPQSRVISTTACCFITS